MVNYYRPLLACSLFAACGSFVWSSASTKRVQSHLTLIPTTVDGIECRQLLVFENVTVLEATAQSQNMLVDWALTENHANLPTGDPYGAVLWPAASALANYLLQSPITLDGRRIWEVGTGTGLLSLVLASKASPSEVLATDYEELPLRLVQEAAQINQAKVATAFFDIRDPSSLPDVDLLLAADVLYEPATGEALAQLVRRALEHGIEVVVADSPGRPGRPSFLEHLRLDVDFFTTVGTTVSGDRHDLICGSGSLTHAEQSQPLEIAVLHLHPSDLLQKSISN